MDFLKPFRRKRIDQLIEERLKEIRLPPEDPSPSAWLCQENDPDLEEAREQTRRTGQRLRMLETERRVLNENNSDR